MLFLSQKIERKNTLLSDNKQAYLNQTAPVLCFQGQTTTRKGWWVGVAQNAQKAHGEENFVWGTNHVVEEEEEGEGVVFSGVLIAWND